MGRVCSLLNTAPPPPHSLSLSLTLSLPFPSISLSLFQLPPLTLSNGPWCFSLSLQPLHCMIITLSASIYHTSWNQSIYPLLEMSSHYMKHICVMLQFMIILYVARLLKYQWHFVNDNLFLIHLYILPRLTVVIWKIIILRPQTLYHIIVILIVFLIVVIIIITIIFIFIIVLLLIIIINITMIILIIFLIVIGFIDIIFIPQ